jgi:hypothetical protein
LEQITCSLQHRLYTDRRALQGKDAFVNLIVRRSRSYNAGRNDGHQTFCINKPEVPGAPETNIQLSSQLLLIDLSTMLLAFIFVSAVGFFVVTGQQNATEPPPTDFTDSKGRTALYWTSVGLVILTSLLQGLATTVVAIAEDQSMWTFRFRIARFEHLWWSIISILLSISFTLSITSFIAGNSNESLGILALSTATTIAIVGYTLPAWRNRGFITNRWLIWTGNSRTRVASKYSKVCGSKKHWIKMANTELNTEIFQTASDKWGFALRKPPGLWQDPTALLAKFEKNHSRWIYDDSKWPVGPCVYDDGLVAETGQVSLLWGEELGFRRRVSRGINSLPTSLLASRPLTDGYNGEGLCLAFGLLGRCKGSRPESCIFDTRDHFKRDRGVERNRSENTITSELENTSSWWPRPHKVLRSYYATAVRQHFGELPPDFQDVVTEMALIFMDIREKPLRTWLSKGLDQQSMEVNHSMSNRPRQAPSMESRATEQQLQTLYEASFTSMVISINYFRPGGGLNLTDRWTDSPIRPDLLCFALLWLAKHTVKFDSIKRQYVRAVGVPAPGWWDQAWVKDRLVREFDGLKKESYEPAAWLLGLKTFPPELYPDRHPEWPVLIYNPDVDYNLNNQKG